MGVLGESWCFCTGRAKTERTKASIYSSKGSTMARISTTGTGFLIHRNLLLTTHATLPSITFAEAAEIHLQNGVAASLFPHRFFITSSVLDLTIVGLDSNMPSQQAHYLKTGSKPSLNLGSIVYLLGYTDQNELTVGEGKVVIATDHLIKVCTAGVTWRPGSAGFDAHGNLSFMVCDPMKLATSTNTKSTSTLQFGVPIPVICDWFYQHRESRLDDSISRPKLPVIRLMLTGQKSKQLCTFFTMRQVFKPTKSVNQPGLSSSWVATSCQDETCACEQPTHVHGIPTPEIYESPKLASILLKKNKNTQTRLVDINFLPKKQPNILTEADTSLMGSVIRSCLSSSQVSEGQNGYMTDGEATMYSAVESAETGESHNYLSPIEGWLGPESPVVRGQSLEKRRQGRKVFSHGETSDWSSDRYSPTVSSLMKKWTNLEQQWQHFIAHKGFSLPLHHNLYDHLLES